MTALPAPPLSTREIHAGFRSRTARVSILLCGLLLGCAVQAQVRSSPADDAQALPSTQAQTRSGPTPDTGPAADATSGGPTVEPDPTKPGPTPDAGPGRSSAEPDPKADASTSGVDSGVDSDTSADANAAGTNEAAPSRGEDDTAPSSPGAEDAATPASSGEKAIVTPPSAERPSSKTDTTSEAGHEAAADRPAASARPSAASADEQEPVGPPRPHETPVPIPESGLPAQPRNKQAGPPPRAPAAPDTTDNARQIRHCQVPSSLISPPIKLPGLSGALVRGKGELLVIVLGADGPADAQVLGEHASAHSRRIPLAARLQSRLGLDLGPLVQQRLKVEVLGKPYSTVAEQAALIGKQIIPRKPGLVIWDLGRSDVRRGLPPARVARALDRGLAQLRKQRIDTIVIDLPYHPQFEALYRTDDYRQYIRWTMNLHDQPFLRRFDMADYWDSTSRIDLDSTEPERQAAATAFTDTCVAFQLSQMIDRALN
ncbi:MAG: hypothetical protein Q4A16_01925 [Lautropia sp.]|nr:hypothetical protein [Lautropia sp.]